MLLNFEATLGTSVSTAAANVFNNDCIGWKLCVDIYRILVVAKDEHQNNICGTTICSTGTLYLPVSQWRHIR